MSLMARGYAISLLAALSWAFTSPGISYLIRENVPSLSIALWRDVIVALAVFVVFAIIRPAALRVPRRTLAGLAIAGVVSIGLYHVLWVYSVKLNGPPIAVVLVYTYNAFVALGARLFFNEPFKRMHLLALAISLTGLVFAVKAYDPNTWTTSWFGALIGVVSAIAQTVYVLFNQRFIKSVNPLVSLGYQMGFGALAIAVLMLTVAPGELSAGMSAQHWIIMALLAVGPTLGGYGFFNLAMRFIPGKIAGLISVLEVPFAAAITWFAFGETLTLPQYFGMLLVLASTVLANGTAESS
jgi:drug/metabolite transporter (DMT)-like permease